MLELILSNWFSCFYIKPGRIFDSKILNNTRTHTSFVFSNKMDLTDIETGYS